MKDVDKEIEIHVKLYEYVAKNIFYTRHNYKIDGEVKISSTFPMYLRNPNEFELSYFRDKFFEKIFSIISAVSNKYSLNDIIYNSFNIFDTSFYSQLFDIKNIYNEYIQVNDSRYIDDAIENNDIKSFSLYLSSFINEDVVLLEIKNWKKIDRAIHLYSNCSYEDIVNYDYRDFFLKKYINFFNIVNFDLRIYKGITLSDNHISLFSYIRSSEYDCILKNVLDNPYFVDKFVKTNKDLIVLMFLINIFDSEKYMRERKYTVDFISCLEFFLVKRLNSNNSHIQNQICLKVRKCCKELGYFISNNEIKDLYDYRSCVVHGNFSELNKKIVKITNRQWYNDYLDKVYSKSGIAPGDSFEREELIYCRLYEIFIIVFKLYCVKNDKINRLKEITEKYDVDNFKFD